MIGTIADSLKVYKKWHQKYPLRGYESRYSAIVFFSDTSPLGSRELDLVRFREKHGISDKQAANIHKKVKLRHERYLAALNRLIAHADRGR